MAGHEPSRLLPHSARPSSRPKSVKGALMASRMILLAEEDPAIAGFLADNLVADGYTELVADDKTAAPELLESDRPAVLLCNVKGDTRHIIDASPGGKGVASQIAPDTPLIGLSAHAD